jgi:hypothetical protein
VAQGVSSSDLTCFGLRDLFARAASVLTFSISNKAGGRVTGARRCDVRRTCDDQFVDDIGRWGRGINKSRSKNICAEAANEKGSVDYAAGCSVLLREVSDHEDMVVANVYCRQRNRGSEDCALKIAGAGKCRARVEKEGCEESNKHGFHIWWDPGDCVL